MRKIQYFLVTCFTVVFWPVVVFMTQAKGGLRADLWHLDYSLFFRYLTDPALFHFTSPQIAAVIERAPSLSLPLYRLMFEAGFDHLNPLHANALIASSIILTGIAASVASVIICRRLGMDAALTFLTTGLVLGCSLFSTGVNRSGAPTMLFNAIAFLAIATGISGYTWAGILIAGLSASFHPITGGIGLLFVCMNDLVSFAGATPKRRYKELFLRALKLAGVSVIACIPLLTLLFTRASSIPVTFSTADFFTYVANKTSVPMPLHDGLSAAVVFWMACLVPLMNIQASRDLRGQSPLFNGLQNCIYFIAICWIGQVFIAEIFQIPALTPLALNFRMGPSHKNIYYLTLGMLAFAVFKHAKRPSALLLFPVCALIQVGIEFNKSRFDPLGSLSHPVVEHLVSTAIIVLPSIWLHAMINRKSAQRLAMAGLVAILIQLALTAVSTRIIVAVGNPNNDVTFASTVHELAMGAAKISAYTVGMAIAAYGLRFVPLSLRNRRIPAILCASQIALFVFLMPERLLKMDFRLAQPVKKIAEARDLIRNNVLPGETIFTVIGDINGIRRQYFDWKHEFFVIYAQDKFPSLLTRLQAARIDFTKTIAGTAFNGWRWLVVPRFHMKFNWVSRLIWDDWRAKWREMRAVEPTMTKVLLPIGDVRPGDVIVGTNNSGYAVVIPKIDGSENERPEGHTK